MSRSDFGTMSLQERHDALWRELEETRAALARLVQDAKAAEEGRDAARAATLAERRAREMAQADVASLAALIRRITGSDMHAILGDGHPGAPVLAIVDAARAAVTEQSTKAYADLMSAVAAWETHNGNTD